MTLGALSSVTFSPLESIVLSLKGIQGNKVCLNGPLLLEILIKGIKTVLPNGNTM